MKKMLTGFLTATAFVISFCASAEEGPRVDEAYLKQLAANYIELRLDHCYFEERSKNMPPEQKEAFRKANALLTAGTLNAVKNMKEEEKRFFFRMIALQDPDVFREFTKKQECVFRGGTPGHRPLPYDVKPEYSGKTEV